MIKLVATGMFFFVALGTGSAWTEVLSQEADNTVAGAALESIFSPRRAPAQKTMGLLQRSFLDLVESSEKALEVALVVDGTDSMAAEI